MKSVDLCLEHLREAPWNPNHMDATMAAKLRNSIARYGVVENLVVRPLDGNTYEVFQATSGLKFRGSWAIPASHVWLWSWTIRMPAYLPRH